MIFVFGATLQPISTWQVCGVHLDAPKDLAAARATARCSDQGHQIRESIDTYKVLYFSLSFEGIMRQYNNTTHSADKSKQVHAGHHHLSGTAFMGLPRHGALETQQEASS